MILILIPTMTDRNIIIHNMTLILVTRSPVHLDHGWQELSEHPDLTKQIHLHFRSVLQIVWCIFRFLCFLDDTVYIKVTSVIQPSTMSLRIINVIEKSWKTRNHSHPLCLEPHHLNAAAAAWSPFRKTIKWEHNFQDFQDHYPGIVKLNII